MAQPKKATRRGVPSLRAIGVSDDGNSILLSRSASATNPTFRVAIDESLVAALEEAHASRRRAARARDQLELPPPIPPRVESTLTVAEIQNLLRQGKSAAAIAKKAGVEAVWVERWEGPIVWERSGTATRARRSYLTRPRGGTSRVSLGDAVAMNLKSKGVRLEGAELDGAWDSVKKPRTDRWVVTFTFTQRSRERTARWEFDPDNDELVALDTLAGELGWVAPIKKRRRA